MNALRKEAEQLRDKGYSYSMITKELGVSKGTMSYWFKNRPFTPNKEVVERVKYGPIENGRRRHNEKVKEIEELNKVGKKELGNISKRDLWMLGLGIYIGEGAKTTESIRISNSDPNVIIIAIRWLKEICSVPSANIVIRLHLYPDNSEKDSIEYWSKLSGLPQKNFQKTMIDRRDNKSSNRRGKLPYGTAHVSVLAKGDPTKGVKLFRRINGWMSGSIENNYLKN